MRAVRILLLAVALMAAGCSSDDDETSASSTSSTTTSTTAPSASSTTVAPFDGTTQPSSLPLARNDTALLETVEPGADGGVDRIVFTFRGSGIPKVDAEYVEDAIADGSGDRIEVVGGDILQLRFEPAATHDLRGEMPEPVYEGPKRVRGATTTITEAVLGGAFEGVLTFFVGVRETAPYRLVAEGNRVTLLVGAP